MPRTWNMIGEILPDWKEYSSLCPAGIHVFTVVDIFYSKSHSKQSGVHLFVKTDSGKMYSFFFHTWKEPFQLQWINYWVTTNLKAGDIVESKIFISHSDIAKIEEIRKVTV